MPILRVSLSGTPDQALSTAVAKELTELTRVHLHKDLPAIAVAIDYIAPEHWFIAGTSLGEQKVGSFSLDIQLTAATNTKGDMAAYQQAVFAAMRRLLGPLHEVSYIAIHELPASAYGRGGLTQEFRYVAQDLRQAA